jgi:hypothetical protein
MVSASVSAADPEHVDLRTLNANTRELIGHRISPHGCVVDVSPHGLFVRPCKSTGWREIIILNDPGYLVWDECNRLGVQPRRCEIEADISGVLQEEANESGEGAHPILNVDAIANSTRHKP